MAFVLTLAALAKGAEQESIPLMASYIHLETLTPPVTEALMRTSLETGQPVTAGRPTAFTDEGWLGFSGQMAALPLDNASLTLAERSIVNTFKAINNPAPSSQCCGLVVPSVSDGLTALNSFARSGSVTFEHEIQLVLDNSLSCDIKGCKITLTPTGGEPVLTSANPFTIFFDKCNDNGDSIYTYLWATFGSDPDTGTYSIIYNFIDADAITIATYTAAYTHTF